MAVDNDYRDMAASEIVQAARLYLLRVLNVPYVASAAYAITPIETDKVPYMGVDKWWRLYYNPEAVRQHPIQQNAGVIYHEIWHLLMNHAGRFGLLESSFSDQERAEYDLHRAWNIATDMEINDDLRKQNIPLPSGALHPSMIQAPEGELAEEYFDRLLQLSEEVRARINPNPGPSSGRCGSCATGKPEEWEVDAPQEGDSKTPGVTEVEADIIRRAVARNVIEHNASQPGSVPAGLARWAESLMRPPQVPWQQELMANLRRAVAIRHGMVDYSRRPNRRQGIIRPGDVVMPSLVKPVPSVAVVLDTSGSISDKDLAVALAEIHGICRSLGNGITVMATDCEVHTKQRVVRASQVVAAGGGGTDMGKGLQAAAAMRPQPDIVVVLTDGYTPWPETNPCTGKVLVVTYGDPGPAWAKTIKINNK